MRKGSKVRALIIPRDHDEDGNPRTGERGEIGEVFAIDGGLDRENTTIHVEFWPSGVWNAFFPDEIGVAIEGVEDEPATQEAP